MFDKLKQLAQMKGLQDAIQKEEITIEKQGVKIVVGGDFSLKEVVLSSDLSKEEQEKVLKDCFNDAVKQIQLLAVQKFSGFMQ